MSVRSEHPQGTFEGLIGRVCGGEGWERGRTGLPCSRPGVSGFSFCFQIAINRESNTTRHILKYSQGG